jgi:hypothetical protein
VLNVLCYSFAATRNILSHNQSINQPLNVGNI